MVNKLSQEFRRYHRNRNHLKHILRETKRILEVVNSENLFQEGSIVDELLSPLTLDRIQHILDNNPAIIVFGQDSKSKAQLVNNLLSAEILPACNGTWRWIKLEYNVANYVSLSLGLEYEVVENLKANEKPWTTIPVDDLMVSENDDPNCPTVVEAKINHSMLQDVQIFIAPNSNAVKTLAKGTLKLLPLFVYALGDNPLSEGNMEELRDLKETYPFNPVLFLPSTLQASTCLMNGELTESEQHRLQTNLDETNYQNDIQGKSTENNECVGRIWLEQLHSLGFLQSENSEKSEYTDQANWLIGEQYMNLGDSSNSCDKSDILLYFISSNLKVYLVDASNLLNDVHTNGLRKFILSAFDMAREIQITPKRIKYVKEMEKELYKNLMKVVNDKQEELKNLIQNIIQEMKNNVTHSSNDFFQYPNVPFEDNERQEWSATVQAATSEVQRLVLSRLGEKVAQQLVTSVNCLRETCIGTLQRCLLKLESSYENDTNLSASDALKQILSAAYHLELHNSSPSLVHSFLERLRQLFKSLPLPWSPTPTLDASWKKKVTIDVLNSLSSARLARTISTQFHDKVKSSHDAFQTVLKSLENHLNGKLERTEEQRVAIRKYHAPRLAKLALESTSMSDYIRFGLPRQTKEIGRGQYGVVFACEGWGGAPGPCAVKSVVPPDDRHWNDLAMEFYYTRSIPDHKRIVKLRGSVIDHTYGSGCHLGSAVLLITDRMSRDLYCGLHSGLSWLERIQISIDVLEGIRYLHSLGLVHRDIKLKNVLLDHENRAKLTDLGFCITEAMMSGSIVGTPVHMAPELMTGHYDSSVDIYAFGILFWYICTGDTSLPYAFEQFHNKEQLWTNVRKGTRPERLPDFSDECWKLMEQCWAGEPSKRPLLGAILPVLESVRQKAERGKSNKQCSDSKEDHKNHALSLLEPNNQRGRILDTLPVQSILSIFCYMKRNTSHITHFLKKNSRSNVIAMREF